MTKELYHKKQYSGYNLAPYFDGTICIAFGHRFTDGKCVECEMTVEFYHDNVKVGDKNK